MDTSIREKIERRAYEIYLRRGSGHGSHEDDWAQAEKEIMAELNKKEVAPTPKVEKEPSPPKSVEEPSVPELQLEMSDAQAEKAKRTRATATSSDTVETPVKKRVVKKKSAA
jgi:hypothetical protein